MSTENKIDKLEEAILIMKELVLRHEERLDEHKSTINEHNQKMIDFYDALEESRKDFSFKVNALIDSEIRKEINITKLKKRIENIENK